MKEDLLANSWDTAMAGIGYLQQIYGNEASTDVFKEDFLSKLDLKLKRKAG